MDAIHENPNPDYYATVTGFDDDIEAWAESVGLTLEIALEEGVCSPDGGDPEIYVPFDVLEGLGK